MADRDERDQLVDDVACFDQPERRRPDRNGAKPEKVTRLARGTDVVREATRP